MDFPRHVDDARYQGVVTILYPFHRLSGGAFSVRRRNFYGGVPYLELDVDGDSVVIPAWMASRDSACWTWNYDAACDWESLCRILSLVESRGLLDTES